MNNIGALNEIGDSNVIDKLNVQLDYEHEIQPIRIDLEDIEDEINYWSSSIICYVVGANPPSHVMEGFLRRIWRN